MRAFAVRRREACDSAVNLSGNVPVKGWEGVRYPWKAGAPDLLFDGVCDAEVECVVVDEHRLFGSVPRLVEEVHQLHLLKARGRSI